MEKIKGGVVTNLGSTVGGDDEELDNEVHMDQPKDGLKGGMVRGEDDEHSDQPEGWYGGENNGMGGNLSKGSTVGGDGGLTRTDYVMDEKVFGEQPKDDLGGSTVGGGWR